MTNAQFAKFVAETGYVTEAERDPPEIPGAPPEMLQPGSAVFRVPTQDNPNWWGWSVGAQWRSPSGTESTIEDRDNDPVVQVTYRDAMAYADWAGMGLPSEEEWEYAARAGAESLPEPKDGSGGRRQITIRAYSRQRTWARMATPRARRWAVLSPTLLAFTI